MDWFNLLDRFGLPTLFSVVLLWGIAKAAKWTATNVLTPLVISHTDFVNGLKITNAKNTECLASLSENQVRIAESQENIASKVTSAIEKQTYELQGCIQKNGNCPENYCINHPPTKMG